MNSVPKLFSCYYADCWTENHFSTEFGVLTLNHTHSHTLFWGCVSRWFGRALAWHARGHRFDPGILHQKSTVLRRKYGAFLFTEADFGAALLRLHVFLAFAENRDVPADKRVPITKETAVQQAAVRRSLLLFFSSAGWPFGALLSLRAMLPPIRRRLPKWHHPEYPSGNGHRGTSARMR